MSPIITLNTQNTASKYGNKFKKCGEEYYRCYLTLNAGAPPTIFLCPIFCPLT